MPLIVDETIGEEVQGGGGGGSGSFPDVANYVMVSDIATPEAGKIYNTIAAAIAYINTLSLSLSNRAVVHVYSKNDASNFSVPRFCQIHAATENQILSGIISASGILPIDNNVFKFENYASLYNFDIQGTIDFSALSTFLEGCFYIKNCIVNASGGGIVTGATYLGLFYMENCQIYKVSYNSATQFVGKKCIVSGTHVYNNTTAVSQSATYYDTEVNESGFPAVDASFTINKNTHSMTLGFVNSRIRNVTVLGTSGISSILTFENCFYYVGQINVVGFNGAFNQFGKPYTGSNAAYQPYTIEELVEQLKTFKQDKTTNFDILKNYASADKILDYLVFFPPVEVTAKQSIVAGNPYNKADWIHNPLPFITVTALTHTVGHTETVIYADATTNNVTLTLPNDSNVAKEFIIKRIDTNTSNYVRITNVWLGILYLRFPGEFVKVVISSTGGAAQTNNLVSSHCFFEEINDVSTPIAVGFSVPVNCSLNSFAVNLKPDFSARNATRILKISGRIFVAVTAANVNTSFTLDMPSVGGINYSSVPANYGVATAYDNTDKHISTSVAVHPNNSTLNFYFKPTTTGLYGINLTAEMSYQ